MSLSTPQIFFNRLRAGLLGPTLTPAEVDGVGAILAACDGWPAPWTAYALSTAYVETNHTMQPVMEAYWLTPESQAKYFFRQYDKAGLRPAKAAELGNAEAGDGARFPGRGYVQITGRANYAKASLKTGADLTAHPELALRADVAAAIMRQGMADGWFTGKKLSDYLSGTTPGTQVQFRQCRRIINGQDRAAEIADNALKFQADLAAGGWR